MKHFCKDCTHYYEAQLGVGIGYIPPRCFYKGKKVSCLTGNILEVEKDPIKQNKNYNCCHYAPKPQRKKFLGLF